MKGTGKRSYGRDDGWEFPRLERYEFSDSGNTITVSIKLNKTQPFIMKS